MPGITTGKVLFFQPFTYSVYSRSRIAILKPLKITYTSEKQTLVKKPSPFVDLLHLYCEESGSKSS